MIRGTTITVNTHTITVVKDITYTHDDMRFVTNLNQVQLHDVDVKEYLKIMVDALRAAFIYKFYKAETINNTTSFYFYNTAKIVISDEMIIASHGQSTLYIDYVLYPSEKVFTVVSSKDDAVEYFGKVVIDHIKTLQTILA